MSPRATHSLHSSWPTYPPNHIRARSHKVKPFSRVQTPSWAPQIYMNLQQAPNDEENDDFLQFSGVCMCVRTLPHTRVDCPAPLSPRMHSVTQPPPRNPKLGRLVCTSDLWPLCSHSSTWHPLAAGAEVGGGGGWINQAAQTQVKWRSNLA